MNIVMIMGRVVRPVETKETQAGLKIAKFTVACDGYKKEDDSEFVRCTAFGKTAEIIEKYIGEGDGIYCSGRMKTESYEKDGVKKYSTGVIVDRFEFPPGKGKKSADNQSVKALPSPVNAPAMEEDEIPF